MRQVTSKVLVSEDGMYHVFGTREFIGLLRAEGAGRAYDESIFYRNVGQELLLILQPKQEVFIKKGLEKAALHGPYWLVGLNKNLVCCIKDSWYPIAKSMCIQLNGENLL